MVLFFDSWASKVQACQMKTFNIWEALIDENTILVQNLTIINFDIIDNKHWEEISDDVADTVKH